MPTLDEQDAIIVEECEVVVAKPVIAAVPIVDNGTLLDVNEDDDWNLDGAFGLGKIERVGMRRKLRLLS